jgi:hypothetical protein
MPRSGSDGRQLLASFMDVSRMSVAAYAHITGGIEGSQNVEWKPGI